MASIGNFAATFALQGAARGGAAFLNSILGGSPPRQILWQTTDTSGTPAIDSFGRPTSTVLYPQVVIEEKHEDVLRITQHPVEQGAAITDHAFKMPATVELRAGWSNSPSNPGLLGAISSLVPNFGNGNALRDIYTTLQGLQVNRSVVSLVTGKRNYTNMLLERLGLTTDEKSENALMITAVFQEVIFAQTTIITVPDATVMKNPSANAATTDLGALNTTPGNNANIPALNAVLPDDLHGLGG